MTSDGTFVGLTQKLSSSSLATILSIITQTFEEKERNFSADSTNNNCLVVTWKLLKGFPITQFINFSVGKSDFKTKFNGTLTDRCSKFHFLWSPVYKYSERKALGWYKYRTSCDSCVSPLYIRLCLKNEKKNNEENNEETAIHTKTKQLLNMFCCVWTCYKTHTPAVGAIVAVSWQTSAVEAAKRVVTYRRSLAVMWPN